MQVRCLIGIATFCTSCVLARADAPSELFPTTSWWSSTTPSESFSFRASSMTLPLYGGIPLYADQWSGNEPNDRTSHNYFHDKAQWEARFQRLASLHYNALVMYHPHPYPLFVDYGPHYPEAAWLKPDELAAKREMLGWLVQTGKQYGIDLYFLTWNIWTPRGFAQARGIEQSGVDRPDVREYSRWTFEQFFRTYPGFGGIMTMPGEAPVGCHEFLRETLIAAMKTTTPRPRFILFTWCAYPPEARQLLDAYDGPAMALHYLQYEQFFYHLADPRIGQYSRELGGIPMTALGSTGNPYLFYNHPQVIHSVVSDLYRNRNGRGLLVQGTDLPDKWLADLAYARTMQNPLEPYRAEVWLSALEQRYGSASLAPPLLELFLSASEIGPTQMKLTHSQSDHFQPQCGMPLIQILQMPTLSTYIFENTQTLNEQGYLEGHLGLSHPNPDWGEEVLEIGQWARMQIPDDRVREKAVADWIAERRSRGFNPKSPKGEETTPLQVVESLEQLAAAAREARTAVDGTLDSATLRTHELERLLHQIDVNMAYADYYAHKDRAAIALEEYRILGQREAALRCLAELEQSLKAWRAYAVAMDAVYPKLYYWQSWTTIPPPYSQNDLWFSYVQRAGTLRELTPFWERELSLMQQRLADGQPPRTAEPPVMDELRSKRVDGRIVLKIDFQNGGGEMLEPALSNSPIVAVTTDPDLALAGRASLFVDSRGSSAEWNQGFASRLDRVVFKPDTHYQITMRYRVIEKGEYSTPFALFLRSPSGGIASDVGESRSWGQNNGVVGERLVFAHTEPYADYQLLLTLRGKAAIVVNEIVIEELPPGDLFKPQTQRSSMW